MNAESSHGGTSLDIHIWAAWVAVAAVLLTPTYADVDLWGHVRFGLDWLSTRALPSVDPYSFTQDRPWINHEWLSEALMGAAFSLGGPSGLILLKVAVVAAVLAILGWRLRGATTLVRVVVLTLGIVSGLTVVLTVRPHLWSLLGLASTMAVVDAPGSPGWRRTAASALIFACWANLHGGWVTGLGALLVWCSVRIVRTPSQTAGWLTLLAASAAATLVNPYGARLWEFLAATVRASRPDITEWAPLASSPLLVWTPLVIVAVLLISIARSRESRPPVEVYATIFLLGAAAIRVSRIASLMAPAALVLIAPRLARSYGHVGRVAAPSRSAAVVLLAPVLAAAWGAVRPATDALGCIRVTAGWAADTMASQALRGRAGRLWTTFNWGEYAIWHFGPALKVSIDGRRETVYSDEVLRWHQAVERGEPRALERLTATKPEYVWLPSAQSNVREWLAARGYRIDAVTARSFIAVRSDLPRIGVPSNGSSGCFP
jgi:hypothetical protein